MAINRNIARLVFQKYNQGLCKKRSVGSVLLNRENLASHLLEESPRMPPPGSESSNYFGKFITFLIVKDCFLMVITVVPLKVLSPNTLKGK